MAAWFEKEYTYIDWDLRRKLTDTGKAVHRFLSSQGKEYEIYTKKLMATIGYLRGYKKFMADLRAAMEQLKVEKWISGYQIIGSGRKVLHKLIIKRRKSKLPATEIFIAMWQYLYPVPVIPVFHNGKVILNGLNTNFS